MGLFLFDFIRLLWEVSTVPLGRHLRWQCMHAIGRRYDEQLKALALDGGEGDIQVCLGATDGDPDYAIDKLCWQYTDGVKGLMQDSLFLSVAADKSRVGTVALQNGFVARPDNVAGWMVPRVVLAGVLGGLILNGGGGSGSQRQKSGTVELSISISCWARFCDSYASDRTSSSDQIAKRARKSSYQFLRYLGNQLLWATGAASVGPDSSPGARPFVWSCGGTCPMETGAMSCRLRRRPSCGHACWCV